MQPNNIVRVITILAVRAIVLTVIAFESAVGASIASLFWLWGHQHSLISVGYRTVIMAWFLGVLFAGFSFLLAIRITQTFLHFNVTLRAWGLSGFFSANWMVLVTEFVMQTQLNQPPHHGVLAVIGAIAVDTFTCICLQSVDHSTYEAADSIIPYTLPEDERERRRHDTADMLNPVRKIVDSLQFHKGMNAVAREIALRIPGACPFERDVKVFGVVLFHIPPLCKLNPLYEEFVGLRNRALIFLEGEGESIQEYL
jgi:hypothetical protein